MFELFSFMRLFNFDEERKTVLIKLREPVGYYLPSVVDSRVRWLKLTLSEITNVEVSSV